jgi:hypothetical protein
MQWFYFPPTVCRPLLTRPPHELSARRKADCGGVVSNLDKQAKASHRDQPGVCAGLSTMDHRFPSFFTPCQKAPLKKHSIGERRHTVGVSSRLGPFIGTPNFAQKSARNLAKISSSVPMDDATETNN